MPARPLRKTGLTIGEIAQRTGLAVSAIRFYEDQGLVAPHRTASGQRRFDRADLRRLSFVRIAQALGFPLSHIRDQLGTLPNGRPPSKSDWARISRGFRSEIDGRITQLEALRDRLDSCIGCGCLSLDVCGLYNDGDKASDQGAGPRYLMGDEPAP